MYFSSANRWREQPCKVIHIDGRHRGALRTFHAACPSVGLGTFVAYLATALRQILSRSRFEWLSNVDSLIRHLASCLESATPQNDLYRTAQGSMEPLTHCYGSIDLSI